MADKSSQLVLSALTRAVADTAGVPLHGTRSTPGLFPATAVGKQAAQRCCEEGYLSSADGSACIITDKGLTYLLGQVSPRQVLEDFVRVLESREHQVNELLESARRMQASLDALRDTVGTVLHRVDPPGGDLKSLFSAFRNESGPAPSPAPAPADVPPPAAKDLSASVRELLARWATSGATEDFPLAELYDKLRPSQPGLTIGAFHDVLRRMHDEDVIYLHPWTGPLYAIPQPPFALLVGHEIAYYASLRDETSAAA